MQISKTRPPEKNLCNTCYCTQSCTTRFLNRYAVTLVHATGLRLGQLIKSNQRLVNRTEDWIHGETTGDTVNIIDATFE